MPLRRCCGSPRTLLAASLAVAAFCVLFAGRTMAADTEKPAVAAFTLTDQHGRSFTAADLEGRPTVMHFGFTHCPVVCPTTLYEVAERLRDLGALADQIRFILVTVDPERDTPEVLKEYIASFDARIVGLTGQEAEIRRLATSVGAKFEKHANTDGGYSMDHSVEAFLLDRNGRRVGVLHVGYGTEPAKTVKALKALIGAEAAR